MRRLHISISVTWLLAAKLALAQVAGPSEQAKARWKEGATALAKGDLEGARSAFKAAYELVPDAELAQSLGEVEFRTGHFADAARHLTKALENRQLPAEERRTSTKSLQKAVTKVGQLFLEVNVPGGELRIDGQPAGVALPIREVPYYLDPGAHMITVRKEGFLEATQNVTATPGQETRASLTLSPELNQEIFKLPPNAVATAKAPAPPLIPSPDPGNPPAPLRWLIAEGAIAVAAGGTGAYFAFKPDASGEDKTLGAALAICGGVIALSSVAIWFATRPSTTSSAPTGLSIDVPRLRMTF